MSSQTAKLPDNMIEKGLSSQAGPSVTEDQPQELSLPPSPRTTPVQWIILVLAVTAFLYFARPVVLPLVLACMAATALKPIMRGLGRLHIPTGPSAALVFTVLVAALAVGFVQLGRPATRWMNEAPEHMAELKARALKLFPNAAKMGRVVATVNELDVADVGKKNGDKKAQTVEIKDQRGATSILNWTGTVLAGLGEVLVLIYLILASGDLFMQKLVRVMPTLRDKKRAVDISHEIQTNISNYLFTVSLINFCLGSVAATGFFVLGIPRALMWGMLVAIINFVPYFGPIAGVILLGIAGLLSFDTLFQGLLPAGWYLLLHLLEANFITPILLGRRFTLNPVAIFVALMFWLWLWGIPGALLAVPILVSVKAICDRFPHASYISELIGR
jgi:predicted PurR-regulated permease PerM